MPEISKSPSTSKKPFLYGKGAAFFFGQTAILLIPAAQAYGVQSHSGTEGLVSHLLGHLLFTLAMVVLFLRLLRSKIQGPGWSEFKWFLAMIISWNVLTFSGHWMEQVVRAEQFVRHNNRITAFHINSFFDLVFYLTRLDHLLLVPAFVLLLLAIRNWRWEE